MESENQVLNPSDAVAFYRRHEPNALAVVSERRGITYRQLNRLINNAAADIAYRCPDSSRPAGLLFEDQIVGLVFSLALLRLGRSQLLLQPSQNYSDRVSALSRVNANCLFSDLSVDLGPEVSVLEINGDTIMGEENSEARFPERCDSTLSPLLYFMGSGTTGQPQLICHSVDELATMIARDIAVRPIGPGDRHCSLTRLNYFTALRRSYAALASCGTIAVLEGGGSLMRHVVFCRQYAVDHLSLVNLHAQEFIRADKGEGHLLPALKSLIIGASPISAPTRKALMQLVNPNLYIGYGTNEFGEACVLPCLESGEGKDDSVGYPCPGVQLRIVDSAGGELQAGQVGAVELLSTVSGGHGDAAAKKSGVACADAWFSTGDLGWLSEEGDLVFVGRSDDMMIFNGINIYPREIEALFEEHPSVKEVAALSVFSDKHGDIPIACVVQKGEPVSANELIRFGRERLGIKAPKRVFFMTNLPKNSAGKVVKRHIRELLSRHQKNL